MGYSVKWVEEHLGITRKALRYYEKEKLMPTEGSRNTNNYREYTEEDLDRIWGIKLLIGIGYTAKEVYAIMYDPNFDFYTSISEKVAGLEKRHDDEVMYLKFAKNIKFTGRIPTVSKLGSIRFDDFLDYCHENWNFYDGPSAAPFMQVADTLISKPPQEWSPDEVERLATIFENLDLNHWAFTFALNGYYQVIADMRDLGHTSETVQRVVRLLHEYMVKNNTVPDLDGKITPQFMAKYTAPSFVDGDIAELQERNYGKDGCLFIAKALSYYGGYDIDEL